MPETAGIQITIDALRKSKLSSTRLGGPGQGLQAGCEAGGHCGPRPEGVPPGATSAEAPPQRRAAAACGFHYPLPAESAALAACRGPPASRSASEVGRSDKPVYARLRPDQSAPRTTSAVARTASVCVAKWMKKGEVTYVPHERLGEAVDAFCSSHIRRDLPMPATPMTCSRRGRLSRPVACSSSSASRSSASRPPNGGSGALPRPDSAAVALHGVGGDGTGWRTATASPFLGSLWTATARPQSGSADQCRAPLENVNPGQRGSSFRACPGSQDPLAGFGAEGV